MWHVLETSVMNWSLMRWSEYLTQIAHFVIKSIFDIVAEVINNKNAKISNQEQIGIVASIFNSSFEIHELANSIVWLNKAYL